MADLRSRYVKLQEELSQHLSAEELQKLTANLEKTVSDVKAEEQRQLREKQAAAELEALRSKLAALAATYPETAAAKKAQRAVEAINPPPTAPGAAAGNSPVPASTLLPSKR